MRQIGYQNLVAVLQSRVHCVGVDLTEIAPDDREPLLRRLTDPHGPDRWSQRTVIDGARLVLSREFTTQADFDEALDELHESLGGDDRAVEVNCP
jgi:hypothetical protein